MESAGPALNLYRQIAANGTRPGSMHRAVSTLGPPGFTKQNPVAPDVTIRSRSGTFPQGPGPAPQKRRYDASAPQNRGWTRPERQWPVEARPQASVLEAERVEAG